ncbi:uncharacterized protein LOC100185464 [Ciona intestinalis]
MAHKFCKKYLASLVVALILLIYLCQSDATLSKKDKKKPKKSGSRPPGVAYDNKKFPNNCHVCRLMVEEIKHSLKGEAGLTEEQLKEKKRKDRRKSKAERKREKALPMLVAIEDVCNSMLGYLPQQADKTKFRYVKSHDLKEVNSLIKSQEENDNAADELARKYDTYRHPETNRLLVMCDEIINREENNLMRWNTNEEKEDLFDYLCRNRVFTVEDSDECLNETSARDDLWVKAFDVVLEKHPELRNKQDL